MAVAHFSQRAELDLLSIGEYTLRTWGPTQAARYLTELEACCRRLTENPQSGRVCDRIRPGIRRMEQGRHVILYRQKADSVLISRILHQSMAPETHNIDNPS
ncbi:MAG: type II toxin-antitoxin system RelE/ParE family toxin [Acidobacteriaceae bacterium]